jgi:mannose-6-phosphate isomerase
MFVRIGNTPRDYAWGSTTAIAELLGTLPSGGPEAELWLGAHSGSPSVVIDTDKTGGATDLAEWVATDPVSAFSMRSAAAVKPRLPFLLKVLAAAGPLSLQAHPSAAQAEAGFARENALGVPIGAPERNYKDSSHKPELIYALSPTFEALCGFRNVEETIATVDALTAAARADHRDELASLKERLELARSVDAAGADSSGAGLRDVVSWLLGGTSDVARLVGTVVDTAASLSDPLRVREIPGFQERPLAPAQLRDCATVGVLAAAFPGDPGIVLALLLNRVTLKRGEVLYLRAGNIHAYLSGLGIELMAASDNVLRGGLTEKHIDVQELLSVLDFDPVPVPRLPADSLAPGVDVFKPDVADFALTHIELDAGIPQAEFSIPGPAIALCTAGALDLAGERESQTLVRGEAVYITPDEARLRVRGTGTLFVATPNF